MRQTSGFDRSGIPESGNSRAFNRSKSDQDPGTWMPPSGEVHCQYAAEWTGTKLRWDLTVDPQEQAELLDLAEQCPTTEVHVGPAP